MGYRKNDNKYLDYTPLVKKITWSGGYDQGARKVELEVLKPRYDKEAADVNLGLGSNVTLLDNGNQIFTGNIIEQDFDSSNDTLYYYALDEGNYLLRNKNVYNFTGATPKEIAEKVAKDCSIKINEIANPKVKLDLLFVGASCYEIIMTAYTEASKQTGKKYMVLFYDNKLNVIEKGTILIPTKISEKDNLIGANYTESIANMINKVKIIQNNEYMSSVKAAINNDDIESYGTFSDIYEVTTTNTSSEVNINDVQEKAKQMLVGVEQTATVAIYGNSTFISGYAVNVYDSHTGLNQKFYIDQDTHTFENGQHKVELTLNYKNIMNEVSANKTISETSTAEDSVAGNSAARKKICAKAKEIYQLCADGKAWYSQPYRTIDDTKRVVIRSGAGAGKYGYDCSSLVGCCYNYAGFSFLKGLSCSGGTLQSVTKKHNATMWRYVDDTSLSKAKPGDIVMHSNSTVTKSNMATVSTHHTLIYMGNGDVIHASSPSRGIRYDKNYKFNKGHFFIRISELTSNDNFTTSNPTSSETGVVDGKKYVHKFLQAVITNYTDVGTGSGGYTCNPSKADICASHNMPYGTKIYIPALKGKANSTGIFTVGDTGMGLFDFDLCTNQWSGKTNHDVYVLSWGTKKLAPSFKYMANLYPSTWRKYQSAFNIYKRMNGKILYFYKFSTNDKGWNG